MLRYGLALVVVLGSVTAWSAVDPTPVAYQVQEGFPQDEILRLQHRNDSFKKGLQGFNTDGVQSVILRSRVWNPEDQPVKVAFLGGSDELRTKIVTTVNLWSSAANIKFDFGSVGAYRQWTRSDHDYAADIRIAFDQQGYWSFVGSDSIDPSVSRPSQASMNFQSFASSLPRNWQGVVLHEFGHAIGFEHEHQSPAAKCNKEFRFDDDPGYVSRTDMYGQFVQDSQGKRPGIYTVLGGPPNNWKRPQVDFNLKQLANTSDLRFSSFDLKSIMMYSFQSWMFVSGENSSCYTAQNELLSQQDQRAAAETYPSDVNSAIRSFMQNFNALHILADKPNLSQDIKTQAQSRLQKLQ